MTSVRLLSSRCTVRRLCNLAEPGATWHVAVTLTRQTPQTQKSAITGLESIKKEGEEYRVALYQRATREIQNSLSLQLQACCLSLSNASGRTKHVEPILSMLIIEPSETARGSCVHDGLYTLNVKRHFRVTRAHVVNRVTSEKPPSATSAPKPTCLSRSPPPSSPLISCISTSNKLKSIGSVGWNQWFRAHRPTRHARCRREPPNPDCRGE